jgi:DNA-binding transcriptional ArsR family regulator
MKDGPNIVGIAALIGDHTRADMLTALMTGQALTATELAATAAVTKQTISSHLARLLEGGLVSVERQGRHRYFQLADDDVARLLEDLMGVAYRTGAVRVRSSPREPALRKARVCYDHLAGELGVLIFDCLRERHLLSVSKEGNAAPELTEKGQRYFRDLGIDVQALAHERRPICRVCLDWSVRRYHLAGALGAAILRRCLELRWARVEKASRVIRFSASGERELHAQFGRLLA